MGLNQNPNAPSQLGVERRDVGQNAAPINGPLAQHAHQIKALHTGPISNIEILGANGTSTAPLGDDHYNQDRPIAVDLYPGDDVSYDVFIDTFIPNAVTGSSGMVNENLSQPITASRIQVSGDGLFLASPSLNQFVRVQFPTSAFPLDRRVLGVRLLVRATATTLLARVDSTGAAAWQVTVPIATGGFTNWTPFIGEALIDDATQPDWRWWTPQMIRDFQSGGSRHWFVRCKAAPGRWWLDVVRMEVFWTPETRIGVGMNPPAAPFEWSSFDMMTPAATGSPSLTTDDIYTVVARQPWNNDSTFPTGANLTWRQMNGSPPVTGWESRPLTVRNVAVTGSTFQLAAAPVVVGPDPITFTPNMLCTQMTTGGPSSSGGTVVETSMPYTLSRPVPVHAASGATAAKTVEQTVTVDAPAASMVYGQTSVVVGWQTGAPPGPLVNLRTEVWTATGAPEVRVFSPVDRTFADIARQPITSDFPTGESSVTTRVIRFRHPESRTLPIGQYEIRVSSPDALPTRPFFAQALIALEQPINQTFGRDVDTAIGTWPSGTVTHPLTGTDSAGSFSSDLQVTLMTVPPAVTGVATAVGMHAAHHATTCQRTNCSLPGCADQGAPFIQLTWSETSDTDSDSYEIQRSDLIDDVFRTVAFIRGLTNTVWQDEEARIGIRSCYRIRSRRPDGVTGDWSDPTCATLTAGQVALSFTSNAATGLAVTYPEIWDGRQVNRDWEFQEYDDVELRAMYGRERQVAFHPLERKGITFERTLLLNALCTVTAPTMNIFAPMRILSWAPLPYICVRDGEGNRWFANIQVPTGRNIRGGEQWFVDVVITEVAAVPTAVDTAIDQVEVDLGNPIS